MTDTNFKFSYNLNRIDKLVFSTSSTLGTYSINSAIAINPSLQTSAAQNTINLEYSDNNAKASLQANISSLNIMKDLLVRNRYSIVLTGNIYTLPNATLYIIIPFILAAANNGSANSQAIEQIVSSAKTQITDGIANTTLSSSCSLNNLITPAKYYYSRNNVFKNSANYNTTFIIYKDDTGMISNQYTNFFNQLSTALYNNITSYGNFKTNDFVPLLLNTPSSNEIMIDCSPIEITTNEGNVLLTKEDLLYGSFENTPDNKRILGILFWIAIALVGSIIIYRAFLWFMYLFKSIRKPTTAPTTGATSSSSD
jgi:hypothetical protein